MVSVMGLMLRSVMVFAAAAYPAQPQPQVWNHPQQHRQLKKFDIVKFLANARKFLDDVRHLGADLLDTVEDLKVTGENLCKDLCNTSGDSCQIRANLVPNSDNLLNPKIATHCDAEGAPARTCTFPVVDMIFNSNVQEIVDEVIAIFTSGSNSDGYNSQDARKRFMTALRKIPEIFKALSKKDIVEELGMDCDEITSNSSTTPPKYEPKCADGSRIPADGCACTAAYKGKCTTEEKCSSNGKCVMDCADGKPAPILGCMCGGNFCEVGLKCVTKDYKKECEAYGVTVGELTHKKEEGDNTLLIIIILCVIGVLLLAVLVGCCIYHHRKEKGEEREVQFESAPVHQRNAESSRPRAHVATETRRTTQGTRRREAKRSDGPSSPAKRYF